MYLYEHILKRVAERHYYIVMLSTLHELGVPQRIFSKDYVFKPPEKEKRKSNAPPPPKSNPSFWNGMPEMSAKERKMKGHRPPIP